MKVLLMFLIFFSNIVFGQINTAEWYPMEKGNYWEYQDAGLHVKKGISIVGDTIMSNGKTYSIFKIKDLLDNSVAYSYRRVDNSSCLYIWRGDNEYKYYDFAKDDSQSWRVDSIYNRRLVKKDTLLCQLFGEKLPMEEFEDIYFPVNGDTIYIERAWQQVYKGVGDVTLGEAGGYVQLVGAIINNHYYGTITSIHNEKSIPSSFLLLRNYPNPFNPSTNIEYSIPKAGSVKIEIYNLQGEKISTLLNEYLGAGRHMIKFNGTSLASGVYFYKLEYGNFVRVNKMLLLK